MTAFQLNLMNQYLKRANFTNTFIVISGSNKVTILGQYNKIHVPAFIFFMTYTHFACFLDRRVLNYSASGACTYH